MYCGNNFLDSKLLAGTATVGTRYKCLKKGIGVGLNMPFDPTFLDGYLPIDDSKSYCGNSEVLPDGYDYHGSLPHCLQKGVGTGRRLRAERGDGVGQQRTQMKFLVYIFLFVLSFSIMLTGILLSKSKYFFDEKTKKPMWIRILPVCFLVAVLVALLKLIF